jgi:hypothetical protein
VYDRRTGLPWPAPLFVAALGASSYTWAEATRDQQMESWLRAHVHAFEYFWRYSGAGRARLCGRRFRGGLCSGEVGLEADT